MLAAMDVPPPSIPFHISRAYGVPGTRAPARVPGQASAAPVAPSGSSAPAGIAVTGGLLAAKVAPPIDFEEPQPPPSEPGQLAFYRHPADRNSAATEAAVGRGLDVTG